MKASLCLCLALLPFPALAELYQWKDEQGRIHFSDRKPADNRPVTALPQKKPTPPEAPPATSDAERQERLRALNRVLRAEDEEREADARRRQQEAQKKRQECQRLQDYLRSIEGRRVYELDDKGERVFIDDATRDARVKDLQRQHAEHCT